MRCALGCRRSRLGSVHLVSSEDGPSDSRQLVGNGDNDDVFVSSLLELRHPKPEFVVLSVQVPDQ